MAPPRPIRNTWGTVDLSNTELHPLQNEEVDSLYLPRQTQMPTMAIYIHVIDLSLPKNYMNIYM